MRKRAIVVAAIAGFGAVIPVAEAARKPSRSEKSAIKRVALKACGSPDCRFSGARVSTRNPHYAWASVVAEGYSGVLVKRRSVHSRRFKVIGFQGGGISACSYWRKRAPRAVLRDLHVGGVLDPATGRAGNCG
jgi:hypothetical protein